MDELKDLEDKMSMLWFLLGIFAAYEETYNDEREYEHTGGVLRSIVVYYL